MSACALSLCNLLLGGMLQRWPKLHTVQAHANHEVVTKLEAVGCEFGPCQNAYTGQEETVYELVVPLDEASLLPGALAILRAFAFDIRCASDAGGARIHLGLDFVRL